MVWFDLYYYLHLYLYLYVCLFIFILHTLICWYKILKCTSWCSSPSTSLFCSFSFPLILFFSFSLILFPLFFSYSLCLILIPLSLSHLYLYLFSSLPRSPIWLEDPTSTTISETNLSTYVKCKQFLTNNLFANQNLFWNGISNRVEKHINQNIIIIIIIIINIFIIIICSIYNIIIFHILINEI